ncbi:MAG: hypothetical protein ACK5RE_08070 [Pseudanabaena sp.]|jgi:hypothetical protein
MSTHHRLVKIWSVRLYLGIYERQLRWFTANGKIVSLPEEQERLAKEQAIQRAERLEEILRSQGIDPNQ